MTPRDTRLIFTERRRACTWRDTAVIALAWALAIAGVILIFATVS